jgi:stress-induced-phosphoprotein 1
MFMINSASGAPAAEGDDERQRLAMADPEIQAIIADPNIQLILRDLQENPASGQQALKDPIIMGKIQKLIAAGILKTA